MAHAIESKVFSRSRNALALAATATPAEICMTNLSGKTALVTGASRGIGRAGALALARSGAQVLVHYGSSETQADAVVAEIRKAGGRAEKLSADLRQALK